MTPADPHLHELDRRERADERGEPRYYGFDTLEDWLNYMETHYPMDMSAEQQRIERIRAGLSARIAALSSLAQCAAYARMVLTAYKVAGGGR